MRTYFKKKYPKLATCVVLNNFFSKSFLADRLASIQVWINGATKGFCTNSTTLCSLVIFNPRFIHRASNLKCTVISYFGSKVATSLLSENPSPLPETSPIFVAGIESMVIDPKTWCLFSLPKLASQNARHADSWGFLLFYSSLKTPKFNLLYLGYTKSTVRKYPFEPFRSQSFGINENLDNSSEVKKR